MQKIVPNAPTWVTEAGGFSLSQIGTGYGGCWAKWTQLVPDSTQAMEDIGLSVPDSTQAR